MKNVIFIAPPVAGKGTQSSKLVDLGYVHISTGNMLREEMKNKTAIGIAIQDLMNNGCLVSDEIVFKLISKRLTNLNKPFISYRNPATGFPVIAETRAICGFGVPAMKIPIFIQLFIDVSGSLPLLFSIRSISITALKRSALPLF